MTDFKAAAEQQVRETLGWRTYCPTAPHEVRVFNLAISKTAELLEMTSQRDEAQKALEIAKARLSDATKDAQSWKSRWEMYRNAWVRELGGWLVSKSHEIDALVLTTRQRCVNPSRGNCRTPHWLGHPTEDRKALKQITHPREDDCRDWVCDATEPNPRAESAEATIRGQAERIKELEESLALTQSLSSQIWDAAEVAWKEEKTETEASNER